MYNLHTIKLIEPRKVHPQNYTQNPSTHPPSLGFPKPQCPILRDADDKLIHKAVKGFNERINSSKTAQPRPGTEDSSKKQAALKEFNQKQNW